MKLTAQFLIALCLFTLSACAAPTAPAPRPTVGVTVMVATSAPTQLPPASPTAPATPTVEPSATVALTPTSPTHYGPDNFPPDINPLTGERVENGETLERRPLAIKVSQFPRRVRPQWGLSAADLVFEHYAEAGVTRMTAIFLGHTALKVGSIRSARLIDTVLGEAYQAMLVTSGSSAGTLDRLARTNFVDRILAEATGYNTCPPLCREDVGGASTDNLFTNTAAVWAIADQLRLNGRQPLRGMVFAEVPPLGGQTVNTLHIDFQLTQNVVEWRYEASTHRYTRWVDTDNIAQAELAPHTDAATNAPLTAANVVVLYVHHQTTDLVEDYGEVGHCGYEIQLWGTGPTKIFRDGQVYDGAWVRAAQADLISLIGPEGALLPLRPGNTWFEVIDLDSPTTQANGGFSTRFKGPSQSDGCPVNQPPTP